ncbi:MAG: redoxin [Pirellulales bacterium]
MRTRFHESCAAGMLLAGLVLAGSWSGAGADEPGDKPPSPAPVVAPRETSNETPREAPRILKPGDHGVGRRVGPLAWTDLDGKRHAWSAGAGVTGAGVTGAGATEPRWLVVAMTSSTCPLSRKYFPVLSRLEAEFRASGVAFLLLAPTATDPAAALRELVAEHRYGGSIAKDVDESIARALQATSTTDVFVLDRAGTVLYHGAVDDQYGLGYARDAARRHYLADALRAIRAGQRPLIAATAAPGCTLDFAPLEEGQAPGANSSGQPTYHNRISRIVQNHCWECHRPGGLGPFSLATLEDVRAHRGMVKQVVERRVMPPWFAEEDARGHRFSNDRSLSESDRRDLLAWLDAGLPAGDPRDAPAPLPEPGEWQVGKPDLVLRLPRAVTVPAEGTMPYQNLIVSTNLAEDRWVQAMEIRPSDRAVVHHVLVFVLGARGAGEGGGEPDERRGFFAAYVPGNSAFIYADGFAKRLPKNARLLFQMHYTPAGKETQDQTELALRFSRETPRHEVKTVGIANTRLRIPPHADNHPEKADLRVPHDAVILGFMPHMHLRGKAFRYDLRTAEGRVETLLNIPRYDFNWQLQYRFAEPLTVTNGSTIEVTGWFDNSEQNPANPAPENTVRWGPQTFDEMLLGYVEYYVPGETPGAADDETPARAGWTQRLRNAANEALFRRADSDRDGRMTMDEARKAFGGQGRYVGKPELLERHFRFLDKDGDGDVTSAEFERVGELP